MKKLLIVEDDITLLEGLTYILKEEGFLTSSAQSIKEAQNELRNQHFDLILLDCNLPDGSGYDFCEEIKREKGPKVLILTARNTEVDELKAFRMGADEYISKPFSTAILIERIKNLFKDQIKEHLLTSNEIEVDVMDGTVRVQGKEVDMTATEYKLLCYFINNKNILLTKDMIIKHIWGDGGEYTDDNNLFVHINRLRGKVEYDPKNPRRIATIHGMGYIWRED